MDRVHRHRDGNECDIWRLHLRYLLLLGSLISIVRLGLLYHDKRKEKFLLLFEVDQVFIVLEDLNIGKSSPRSLYLLHCHLFFTLGLNFLLSFFVAAPCPLDLDGSDMIHGESMILEESPGQSHLIRCLYECCTEIPPALLFTPVEDVEGRGEELGTQFLIGCQMLHLTCC